MELNVTGLDEDVSTLASFTTSKLRISLRRQPKPMLVVKMCTIILTMCNSTTPALRVRPVPLREEQASKITRRFRVTGDQIPQYLTAEDKGCVRKLKNAAYAGSI